MVTWEVCTGHLAELAKDGEVAGGWTGEGPPLRGLHCEGRLSCHLWPDGPPVQVLGMKRGRKDSYRVPHWAKWPPGGPLCHHQAHAPLPPLVSASPQVNSRPLELPRRQKASTDSVQSVPLVLPARPQPPRRQPSPVQAPLPPAALSHQLHTAHTRTAPPPSRPDPCLPRRGHRSLGLPLPPQNCSGPQHCVLVTPASLSLPLDPELAEGEGCTRF